MTEGQQTALKFFPLNITKKQASDTGMAMVLILLLIGFFAKNDLFYKLSIPVLILNMIAPMAFYFVAVIWLGLSNLLGSIVSKILLSVVYILLVFPVGILRRMAGKDTLQLRVFKKGNGTVMHIRDYTFKPEDIEKPY